VSERDERDSRATRPPAEGPPEEEADEGGAGETHGPLGNPATDEESLRHRQQEGAERTPRGNEDPANGEDG
jgi:hypothetical protein